MIFNQWDYTEVDLEKGGQVRSPHVGFSFNYAATVTIAIKG